MFDSKNSRIQLSWLLASALIMPTMHAVEVAIPHVKCEITLSKSTITSGEPVCLRFAFTNTSDGLVSIHLQDSGTVDPQFLKISVYDEYGNEVPRRTLQCHPASQRNVVDPPRGAMKPGETVMGEYPIHLRVPTRLEPGHYSITVKAFDVVHGYLSRDYVEKVGSGVKVWQSVRDTYSAAPLSLEVEAYDEERLIAAYESIMQEARYAVAHLPGSWYGHDYMDIPAPIRTILWAAGPEAVRYQLELVYDSENGFTFWPPATVHTWENVARHATIEQVRQLVDIASVPEFRKEPYQPYTRRYAPGLVWALHEMHQSGPEPIRELTRNIVEKLPKEELCPRSMEIGVPPYGKG